MKIRFSLMLLLACGAFGFGVFGFETQGYAQKGSADEPVGIFETRSQYDSFMSGVKQAAYGEGGSPELQAMVPLLNDIALNQPVGWTASEYGINGGVADSNLGLLSDADIREDLEMMDDQYERLQQLNADVQKRASERIRELDFSDRENVLAKLRDIREQAANDLGAVLLPHQIERLNQIRMQSQLQRRSLVEILTSKPVKQQLEITDGQSSELKQTEKEIKAELEREIAKLRTKAREKILSKLNPTQKEAVKNMLGNDFEFKAKANANAKEKSARVKSSKRKQK